jgi:hypothetical protein
MLNFSAPKIIAIDLLSGHKGVENISVLFPVRINDS